MSDQESGIDLQLDILLYTSGCTTPSDIDRLISESTALLSPILFDKTQTAYLKSILESGKSDDRSWQEIWIAYKNDPSSQKAKLIVLDRLRPYYTYILQQGESQLM
jgi:hypothetical protein